MEVSDSLCNKYPFSKSSTIIKGAAFVIHLIIFLFLMLVFCFSISLVIGMISDMTTLTSGLFFGTWCVCCEKSRVFYGKFYGLNVCDNESFSSSYYKALGEKAEKIVSTNIQSSTIIINNFGQNDKEENWGKRWRN